mgnify:CR=1 FL=1
MLSHPASSQPGGSSVWPKHSSQASGSQVLLQPGWKVQLPQAAQRVAVRGQLREQPAAGEAQILGQIRPGGGELRHAPQEQQALGAVGGDVHLAAQRNESADSLPVAWRKRLEVAKALARVDATARSGSLPFPSSATRRRAARRDHRPVGPRSGRARLRARR